MSRSFVSVGRRRGGGIVCFIFLFLLFFSATRKKINEEEGRWENGRIGFANVSAFLCSAVLGQANMYANLHVPGSEPKVKDGTGKEWDVVTPSAFHFEYVRDSKAEHDGVRLKSTRIFADSGPALMMMLRRGQMKPADLGL